MDTTLEKKLQGFQIIAQEKLQSIIYSIPGKRNLILEPAIIKPLEHVCTASWLKLKGIQHIYKYEQTMMIPRASDHVHIYMIRNDLKVFQSVLSQLLQHVHKTVKTNEHTTEAAMKFFHIICVPNCYMYFQQLLEAEGLYGLVELHRYNWDFIYFDQGVLSLEMNNVYKNLFMQQDTSPLSSIVQSMRLLQMTCGSPELIISYGAQSELIIRMLKTLGPMCTNNAPIEMPENEFSAMVILDRDRDYASSLLTPAIYAGLLLEVFQQRCGSVLIESGTNKILRQKLKIFLSSKEEQQETSNHNTKLAAKATVIRLNSETDEIYGDNRYKHFSQASGSVRSQAKTIGLELQKLNDMKLDEMHDYVARKLPKVTDLKSKIAGHLNASEIIVQMLAGNFRKVQSLEEDILNNVSRKRLLLEIDETLTTDGQKYNTLRLLCLLHLCAGISADELQQFARNYCNYFGHSELAIFQQLAKAGLLPHILGIEQLNRSTKLLSQLPLPKFQQTEFQANANRLRLLVSSAGVESHNDMSASGVNTGTICPSYVFNGLYIPLIAQICNILLKATSAEDFSTKLAMIEQLQLHFGLNATTTPLNVKTYAAQVKSADKRDIFPLRLRNLLVFVVGGLTYAEIAACNFIARQNNAQIIVTSDCIISGSDLIAAAS